LRINKQQRCLRVYVQPERRAWRGAGVLSLFWAHVFFSWYLMRGNGKL
jgi:hypothetical protein